MKKTISTILSVLIIVLGFAGCAESYQESDDKQNSSYDEISKTDSFTSVQEPETETKEIYYPTPEEYMEKLQENLPGAKMDLSYSTSSGGTKYANITWSTQYNKIVKMDFDVQLFLDNDEKVKGCSSSVIHEKFVNVYSGLLNDVAKKDVIFSVFLPTYLLTCLHSNTEYDTNNALGIMSTVLESITNSGEYNGKISGCDFSASLISMGINSFCDFNNAHQ